MSYLTDKAGAVRYVDALLHDLPNDCALTTTITPLKSGDYSVTTVIIGSSEGYDEALEIQRVKFYSDTQVNT